MSAVIGVFDMGSHSWRALMAAKRERAIYRITVQSPNGQISQKICKTEHQYNRWLATYLERQNGQQHDVKVLKTELVYR